MEKTNITTKNSRETIAVAKAFAKELMETKSGKHAAVIGLVGELGAGKTLFVKSFMRAIGVRQKLVSPTFILMRNFRVKNNSYTNAYHIDAYRVDANGLRSLGIKDIIKNPNHIVLIEWADRVRGILPSGTIMMNFKYGDKQNERHITFNRR